MSHEREYLSSYTRQTTVFTQQNDKIVPSHTLFRVEGWHHGNTSCDRMYRLFLRVVFDRHVLVIVSVRLWRAARHQAFTRVVNYM